MRFCNRMSPTRVLKQTTQLGIREQARFKLSPACFHGLHCIGVIIASQAIIQK
jgi:hypothetical protein